MFYISSFIFFSYVALVFYALYGWQKTSRSKASHCMPQVRPDEYPTISIIVVLRNEIQAIPMLIASFDALDYPEHLIEILLVDDHSTDDSFAKLCELTQGNSMYNILQCPQNIEGKKTALAWSVAQTNNDYILFTDADCQVPSTWISAYVEQIVQHKSAYFLFGLVNHSVEKTFLQQWFSLDFLSLVAMQGGLAKVGKAFSCNAANMCISRQFALTQYETNSAYSSGDDVFLLHKAKLIDKEAVVFVQSIKAMVITKAPETVKQFIKQRIRWASKTGGYKDRWSLLVAAIVYATSLCIVGLCIVSMFNHSFFSVFCTLFIAKTLIDSVFFACILPHFHKQKLLPQVVLFQAFYVLYIVLIPIFVLIIPQSWKGRKIT
ncbi:MAG: glycosyltransferase [Bacteroidales bacterium]|jgi:cellulose synthase/poly-beta-1,6-N-acetylglucosamine synthase-like glycosyltransferase|nr:glycosyltransferase [Bacteroidales bacterium]